MTCVIFYIVQPVQYNNNIQRRSFSLYRNNIPERPNVAISLLNCILSFNSVDFNAVIINAWEDLFEKI